MRNPEIGRERTDVRTYRAVNGGVLVVNGIRSGKTVSDSRLGGKKSVLIIFIIFIGFYLFYL